MYQIYIKHLTTHPFTEGKPEFLLPHAIARLDGKVEYLTSVPYRDTEHKADKAVAVEVIGTIMGGMVKQFGDILKHSAEFWSYGVIYTEKNRLGALAIGDQRIPSPV